MEPYIRDFLSFKIKTIDKMITQLTTNEITSLELTSSQAFVLGYLYHRRNDIICSRDIEKQFNFSHPTVSGLLQRLEAKGFIVIKPSPSDRRCKQISITDRAIRVNQQILNQLHASEQLLVRGISPEDISHLREILDQMIRNIENASTEGGTHP